MSTIDLLSVFSDAWRRRRRRRGEKKIVQNRLIAQESDQRVGSGMKKKRAKKPENNMDIDLGTELQDQENEHFHHDDEFEDVY